MSNEHIVSYTINDLIEMERQGQDRSDWERVRRNAAAGIEPDTSDLPKDFWEQARVIYPPHKETVTMRLDSDVLWWFKGQGRGYQTRINAVLRAYIDAMKTSGQSHRDQTPHA